ncbi:putative lipid scramblase CLPTM1 [Eucyclogobius newberryi]|uniref:putative lipid scramblase CLPTM1 n=1 Tax=Eucyclogobius newberryi TaxID=166745 RepID=UPI003B58F5FE
MATQETEPTKAAAVTNGEVSTNGSATTDGQAVQAADNALDPQQQPPQQPPNAWQVIKGVLFRIFIIWAISSWFRRGPSTPDPSTPAGAPRVPSRNLFAKDTLMDMHVYISPEEVFTDFNNTDALFWFHRDLVYGDWNTGDDGDGCYYHDKEMDIPETLQNNGSLYIHVYFTKSGFSPDPKRKGQYRRLATVHASRMLNKFKRRKFLKTKNLLTGETEADPEMIKRAESHGPVEIISHWHPNLTINIVDDHTAWVKGSVPPPLDQHVKFDAVSGDYYPIVYFNDYWNLQKDYYPINETLLTIPLRLTFCPLSLWRWQLYAAQNARSPWNFLPDDTYEQSDEDQDSVKVALLETNPYLLGLTIVVSIVHSIFEFLAFKNDIQFWNSRQSLEGLSVRSIIFGVFQSLVVLLYILDNETNFVVQVSVFIGLLIDLWKITKVMDVKLDRENKIAGLIPRLVFNDKSTYVQSSTKIYDDMAFKYLSWFLYPLFGCYAIYSLLYVEHKGWYSWVLSMMYGFLLTFGFITMTPQLFINYKMKSVAHLPWRMLTYKALNTFIDDLFAFVIKMPMMYRIGCLRDDVVFFIYLYQRWIYRVDPNRVNEFGTSGVDPSQNNTAAGEITSSDDTAIASKSDGEREITSSDDTAIASKSDGEREITSSDDTAIASKSDGEREITSSDDTAIADKSDGEREITSSDDTAIADKSDGEKKND